MIGQNPCAGLAQPRAVLLEACQDSHIALIHHRPAMTADIARASRIRSPALRRRCCDQQKERDDEKKSGHVVCLRLSNERDQKPVPQTALEPVTPSLRSANSPSSGSSRQDSPDTLKSPSQRVLYNVGPIHSSELQRTVVDTGRMRGIAAAQQ